MMYVTRKDVYQMGLRARGKVNRIYVHWTAGRYDQPFRDYHLNLTDVGRAYASCEEFTTTLAHTWHRNTGAIGLALCCAKDAVMYADGSFDLGDYPPTPMQIEETAILCFILSEALGIPIDPEHIMTHAEAADLDGYGPALAGTSRFERWDLYKLLDFDGVWRSGGMIFRGKALYYQQHASSVLSYLM
jgi:hypothetical protein